MSVAKYKCLFFYLRQPARHNRNNNSSKSADSAKGDIDGIMVGGGSLKMIDVDALPCCAHRLVLEHVIHARVESIEIDW